jgi:hypothetical protein
LLRASLLTLGASRGTTKEFGPYGSTEAFGPANLGVRPLGLFQACLERAMECAFMRSELSRGMSQMARMPRLGDRDRGQTPGS